MARPPHTIRWTSRNRRWTNGKPQAALAGQANVSKRTVERLCYTGTRGMGALEFAPELGPKPRKAMKIEMDALVRLGSEVLTHRNERKPDGEGGGHRHE